MRRQDGTRQMKYMKQEGVCDSLIVCGKSFNSCIIYGLTGRSLSSGQLQYNFNCCCLLLLSFCLCCYNSISLPLKDYNSHTAMPFPTLPYPALPCPTLPYPALPYSTLPSLTLPYPSGASQQHGSYVQPPLKARTVIEKKTTRRVKSVIRSVCALCACWI